MVPLLLAIALTLPFIDLYLLLELSSRIGFPSVLLVVLSTAIVGGAVARSEGLDVLLKLSSSVTLEEVSRNMLEGLLILFGAFGLLIPGLLTDLLGASIIFRPFRQRIAFRLGERLKQSGNYSFEVRSF